MLNSWRAFVVQIQAKAPKGLSVDWAERGLAIEIYSTYWRTNSHSIFYLVDILPHYLLWNVSFSVCFFIKVNHKKQKRKWGKYDLENKTSSRQWEMSMRANNTRWWCILCLLSLSVAAWCIALLGQIQFCECDRSAISAYQLFVAAINTV